MQSNNPVFRRSEEFHRSGANAYANQTYTGNGATYQGYGSDPSTWGTGTPGATETHARSGAPMTVDSVVQKTAITVGIVFVAAFATWLATPAIDSEESLGSLYGVMVVGSIGALVLSLVNSFKRNVSPALVLAFAALEGVAMGAFSKVIDNVIAQDSNVVVQAVVGTFAAFAGTLAAYKFFNIQVGQKFRTFVVAAMFGMVALGLMEFVLSFFSAQLGLFGFGGLGLLMSVAGLVLGIFMLILDFDYIEQGIANRIPEVESWRAAFGLTVTLVWIYTNLLRILAILQQD